jgi:hypothetical protein
MATIRIKRGTSDPTAAQVINAGELAANISTPKIWLKTADDGTTTPVWVGAQIEASPGDWTSATKLATQSAINTTFMPKAGGTFTSDISLSGGSDIRFVETGGGTDFIALQAPAAVATSITFTLPNADGTNGQFLSTNGSGTLAWSSTGTATSATNLSGGATGSIPYQSGASTTIFLSAGTSGDILTYGGSAAPVWSSGTGTGSPVRATAPTFATTIDGGASFGAFPSSTTLTIGSTGTGTSTTNISTGAVTTLGTKTINIGTGSAAGGTTDITIGATSGTSTVYIKGNLQVDGTTTTLNTTNLTVDDLNIIVGDGVTTAAGGDGAGLSVGTSGVTFTYNHTNTAWQSTDNLNIATGKTYKINGTTVLSGSSLGSGVTGSSLTSVGTITSGTWNGTDIGLADGGTNASLTAVNGGIVYSSASALAISSAGTSSQVLLSGGAGAPTWTNQSSLAVGSATTSTTATNIIATEQTTGTMYLVGVSGASNSTGLLVDATAQASLVALSYNNATATLTTYKVEAIVDGGTY